MKPEELYDKLFLNPKTEADHAFNEELIRQAFEEQAAQKLSENSDTFGLMLLKEIQTAIDKNPHEVFSAPVVQALIDRLICKK